MADPELPFGAKTIRASSLPTWPDCERRWVAVHRRALLAGAGFTTNTRVTHIGAHVGSSAHAGVGHGWLELGKTGSLPPMDYAKDVAVETLRERVKAEGVMFDDTTPDLNNAELAAHKIIVAYREHMDLGSRAILVEQFMAGRVVPGSDWYLTGHCDAYMDPEERFDDLKTGVRQPSPIIQVGGYNWLGQTRALRAKRSTMTFCRRVRRTADQPPPLVRDIPPALAVRLAKQTVAEIVTKVETFENATSPDPLVFRANPSSTLCTNKYCPAFHTRWCPESMLKPEE